MDFSSFSKLFMDVFPLFIDWIKWLTKISDVEFESISKAWPSPTKTKLAWIRAESKANDVFFNGQ